ncbi:TolC family protein [Novosphingobium guangzhouense]|uniref:RND transporter n=1 Tax=Novosphingobium guangzhouense TaxID=1850347 RepID=A0A2K2FVC1_9SPHN|nr:TolC family protein [Novosphingobium guangzhouense]PNU02700.1 RND transporter [Novosphingobium guangzhouense]
MTFLLACSGCASTTSNVASAPPPEAASGASVAAETPAWWREMGDPVLATLVQQGLDTSPEVICRIAALRQYDYQTEHDAKQIGARLGRLLGDKSVNSDPQIRTEKVDRVSSRREQLARRIALAYVEVRRLQQDVALRGTLRAQYKDNAEVAQFRREAGLVPAIDGSLARSQDETAQGELGFAQGRLDQAMAELARLVGDEPTALSSKLGSSGAIPDPAVDPLATAAPDDARRSVLADAVLREARLNQALGDARRTVRDARIAYREGAGDFSTLYVAEAAALSVELALVDARAGRVAATLDLWAGQNAAWAREGLAPVVAPDPSANGPTITVTAGCD